MAAFLISGSEMPRKRRLLGDDLGIDVPLLQMFSVDQETGQVSAKAKERERKAEERAKGEKEVAEKKSGNATVGATSALVASTDLGSSCSKKPHRELRHSSPDSRVDTNVCCMCFGLYVTNGDGCDWIECVCGCWLHEDCAEDCILDKDGKEMFCHSCTCI